MKILITGGTGYIGSHIAVELLDAGHEAVLLDNLCNSSRRTLSALRRVTGSDLPFIEGDIRDGDLLDGLFKEGNFAAVMHVAALKSVAESARDPLRYYANNVEGTARLAERMSAHGVKTLVFSSSAAVYGDGSSPLTEDAPTTPASPYGRTKLIAEHLLGDLYAADPSWRISILRYFNVGGTHPASDLGEDPPDVPANLLPRISQIAFGLGSQVDVFGSDYPTPDGTCVRDYLHVVDVAGAHLKALDYLDRRPGLATHNLGTANGASVMDVLHAFERACGRPIPYRIVAPRPGDVAISRADPSRARDELGWTATRDLDHICADLWRWQLAQQR